MAASGTPVHVAAESCRAAVPDGAQHFQLWPGQMIPVAFDEAVARCTDDIGHLEGGPAHFFSSLRDLFTASGRDTESASSGFAVALR